MLPSDSDHRKQIEKDLEEIGLLQLDQDGGQFIHATYQEYFAACYLLQGLKYQELTVKFQQIREFIVNHRNSSQYDQVFLYAAQIFKAKIQHSEEGKRKEYLSMLMTFLKIYFSNLEQPLISLINTIYEIAKETPCTEEFKTFVTKQINPFVKEILRNATFDSFRSTSNELQTLLSNHPYLKDDLELPELITQTFNELKKEEAIQKISWILNFINKLKISMDLSFLLKLSHSTNDGQVFEALKALEAALPEKADLERPAVDEINRLISIALLSSWISDHFPVVICICKKIGEQISLADLFTETAKTFISQCSMKNESSLINFIKNESSLINFIEFMKTEKPYDYIKSDLIDCLVKSKMQAIIPDLIHFLIIHTTQLIETNNTDQLKKIKDWFSKLFKDYKPFGNNSNHFLSWNSSNEPSKEYEMLMSIKQSLVAKKDPTLSFLVNPIFNLWDMNVVQKDLMKIIENYPLYTIRAFLNQPPAINLFSFNSREALAAHVIALAKDSTQSAKNDNPNRTSNWNSIGAFLADKKIIDMMDDSSPRFVDRILSELLQLSELDVHGNSNLLCEICLAITDYKREETSQTKYDWNRIESIKKRYPSDYTGIPQSKVDLKTPQIPIAVDMPKKPLGFNFDFSYYGYSDTLVQLKSLVSQNPNWIQNFITPKEKENLKELENNLIIEMKTIANIDNDPHLLEKKTKELAIVRDLLQRVA